ncbi:MAG: lectin like domain-containing protein [Methanolobus sp.]
MRNITLLLLTFLFISFSFSASASRDEVPVIHINDPNPEFQDYLDNKPNISLPEVIDFSYLEGGNSYGLNRIQATELNIDPSVSYFDLRNENKVTSVKDQDSCNSCWAFASFSSLESYLMQDENLDFSEKNMLNLHGFDLDPCEGGNDLMSIAYLARWDGPVSEKDDPYEIEEFSGDLTDSPSGLEPIKHVQEVIFIPKRTFSLDNYDIKEALQEYGAVDVSMYFSNAYFDPATNSYYYSGDNVPNHDVAIVGWDDDFSFSALSSTEKGAFIVKNSYGESWGEDGYFYVSYYDSQFAMSDLNTVFTAEDEINYDYICQYDTLGMTALAGLDNNAYTSWGANIFTAQNDEVLEAVSFYAPTTDTSYDLYIYTSLSGGFFEDEPAYPGNYYGPFGNLEYFVSDDFIDAGYHTLKLSEPVNLNSGENFAIVLKLTTPGLNEPLPIEKPKSGYSSEAQANDGESYVSADGGIWLDLNQALTDSNLCIKAFTSVPPIEYPVGNIVDELDPTYEDTGEASSAGGSYAPGSQMSVFIYIQDEGALYDSFTIVVEPVGGNPMWVSDDIYAMGNSIIEVPVNIPSTATDGSYHVYEENGKLTDDFFEVSSDLPEFSSISIPMIISVIGYFFIRRKEERI